MCVLINKSELYCLHRKNSNNMILAGLWFGKAHPVFNTFMKPIRETLLRLEQRSNLFIIIIKNFCYYKGIKLRLPNGNTILTKGFMLSGVYDIPAKCDALGFANFRGEYACTRCLNPGKLIRTAKGKKGINYSINYSHQLNFRGKSTRI